jgi:nucleoside diphosphate kinase
LAKEEILNLLYPYRNATFFADIQEHLMTAESIVMVLINKVETVYDEQKDEDVKLESPIVRWKALVGDKNPNDARASDPKSLRAIYGIDIIKNAFHGSDDPKSANKERDIFLFPIPERPPEFSYIRTKITMDTILKFLFPPNLEHSNSTGRLDLFALYGPIVCYHSVDACFCGKCTKIAKAQLEESIKEKQALERKRLG